MKLWEAFADLFHGLVPEPPDTWPAPPRALAVWRIEGEVGDALRLTLDRPSGDWVGPFLLLLESPEEHFTFAWVPPVGTSIDQRRVQSIKPEHWALLTKARRNVSLSPLIDGLQQQAREVMRQHTVRQAQLEEQARARELQRRRLNDEQDLRMVRGVLRELRGRFGTGPYGKMLRGLTLWRSLSAFVAVLDLPDRLSDEDFERELAYRSNAGVTEEVQALVAQLSETLCTDCSARLVAEAEVLDSKTKELQELDQEEDEGDATRH